MKINLPEGRYSHFDPGNGGLRNGRHKIRDRFHHLQKNKSLQYAWVENTNTFFDRGIIKCDKLLLINTPNRMQNVTMNQVLMLIKSQENFRSSLFTGVDIQSDGSIIISCNISLRKETENFVAHLPIYLEYI